MINHIDETNFSYSLPIDVSMYNQHGIFYPAAYQNMVIHTIERHLEKLEMDVPRLIHDYGISWILLAMSIELRRPLQTEEMLSMQTWHTSQPLPIYRREFRIIDASGATAAVGTTFTALMDINKRRLCTDRNIMHHFEMDNGEQLIEAVSRFNENPEFHEATRLTVHPSWIDGLGHVNNSRYGEFVYDALTRQERDQLAELRRMDVWFMAELKPETEFAVEKAVLDGALIVRGVILPQRKPSFVMKLTF